ncbi:hypothetical protein [Rhodohalobacter sulfatireducens]|uniref:Uncharacterized protein n=1 Tax=Rhodohalobacter sulfatireducens TaxID=2911366 RepID=A0ABS9KHR8_9BACT|nr:hypothetical protein [Rhodohalobacter sulfatireducens]MCG2590385.1 hypothetical protein [Rhodohalobacter sulfatireducens]
MVPDELSGVHRTTGCQPVTDKLKFIERDGTRCRNPVQPQPSCSLPNDTLWCRTSYPAYIVQRAASPLLINSNLLREMEQDVGTRSNPNIPVLYLTTPCGAGQAVRRTSYNGQLARY